MKTAAAYIRVSTEDQVEFSPDSQLKAIRKYAKEHELILPQEYIYMDEGISGRKADKRPAFQRMIGTAKTKPKPFDVILLWKFSRFARNREDSIVYKSMLRKQCGIEVVSISEQLTEDKTSILMEAMIEAMDEYYSLNLAEEVKRGMTEKFSRGGVTHHPPFGYKMGDGEFVPDDESAPIVQMIFNDYLSGLGSRQIASKLNAMGIRTPKGNFFENRTVEYILCNPCYIGKHRRRRDTAKRYTDRFCEDVDIVDGKHEPIIDDDTFEAVQERRAEIKRRYTKHARSEPAEYMLKGIVRCDKCGATLVLSADRAHLQCHRYAKGTCKISHSIKLDKLNGLVLTKLKEDLDSGTFEFMPREQKKPAASIATDSLLEREKKKLERVKEAYEAGVDTLEEYKANKAKITAKIAELEALETEQQPKTSEEAIRSEFPKKLRACLESLKDEQLSETTKNETLKSIIERITFIKPGGIVEILYRF